MEQAYESLVAFRNDLVRLSDANPFFQKSRNLSVKFVNFAKQFVVLVVDTLR